MLDSPSLASYACGAREGLKLALDDGLRDAFDQVEEVCKARWGLKPLKA